jgi:uncharacterized protein (TIGR03067 family)
MWSATIRNRGYPVKPTALVTMLLLSLSAPRYGAAADPSGAAEQDSPIAADRDRYAGTWRVVSIEGNGEVSADETRSILVDNHPDGTWTLTVDGREVSRGTSTIDPLAVPKEIDLEITAGDGSGSILKGIYEVGEKTRRLCFRGGNGWRPREFSGAAGSDSVLIVFKRQ